MVHYGKCVKCGKKILLTLENTYGEFAEEDFYTMEGSGPFCNPCYDTLREYTGNDVKKLRTKIENLEARVAQLIYDEKQIVERLERAEAIIADKDNVIQELKDQMNYI